MNKALEGLLGDSSRITMDQNAALAVKNPRMIRDLLDLVYLQKDKFSPRAARVIYFTSKLSPNLIDHYMVEIIMFLPKVKNSSIKMNLCNLLWQFDLRKFEEHLGVIVDLCFKWLSDPSETVAIKVYCMEILYKISLFIPDLRDELASTIEDQVLKGSMGVKCRGGEVLKRMQSAYN
jgi:hypothetical protein